jgi:hypothetical protein
MAHPPSYQKVSTANHSHRAKADTKANEVVLRPRGCSWFFCDGSRFLFGGVGNTVATHQQPVGVDAKWRTRHQRD